MINYPLKNNTDNNVLEVIQIIGSNASTIHILKYGNIERLINVETIAMNVVFANQAKNIEQFNYFYDLIFSKIYNETDNAKAGYSISEISRNSGYFSTVAGLSSGFVHPKLRTINMTDNNTTIKDDSIVSVKLVELRALGMTLVGNQLE